MLSYPLNFGFDPENLENKPIYIRGRYLGVCSIVKDGTLFMGPAFRDVNGGIWFLASGAASDSIDSVLEMIRLDRDPEKIDVPPLLAFQTPRG
jgi:hypothetical protein